MTTARELVRFYVRRFGGWQALRVALAQAFAVDLDAVRGLKEDPGDAPIRVDARAQTEGLQLRVEVYVDRKRAPRVALPALARSVAAMLGEDVAYDDGASSLPSRWVLVRPSGERFEVFERGGEHHGLVLDEASGALRRLDAPL